MKYFTVLTHKGIEKLAKATAQKSSIKLKDIALGDANGSIYTPDATKTSLVNEVFRTTLNDLSVDKNNPDWVVAQGHITSKQGGFWIREVGIFDEEGDLIAIGNYPGTFKPVVLDGVAKDLYVKVIFKVSNSDAVTLQVESSQVMASKEYVNAELQKKADITYVDAIQTGMKNLLINGDFKIWQRGETIIKSNGYTADRWICSYHTDGVDLTFKKENPSHAEIIGNSVRITSSNVSGVRQWFGQRFENDLRAMSDGTKRKVTLSFWAKGNDCLKQIYNGGTDKHAITLTTNWKKFTVTFSSTEGLSALCFLFKDGVDIDISIAQVQLEVGDKATDFENRPYELELSLCQRYYETTGMKGWDNCINAPLVSVSDSRYVSSNIFFKVRKRIPPSIKLYNPYGSADKFHYMGTTSYAVAVYRNGIDSFNIYNVADLRGSSLYGHYTADAEVY